MTGLVCSPTRALGPGTQQAWQLPGSPLPCLSHPQLAHLCPLPYFSTLEKHKTTSFYQVPKFGGEGPLTIREEGSTLKKKTIAMSTRLYS